VELRESAVQEINETFEVGGLCLEMEHQELRSNTLDSCYIVTGKCFQYKIITYETVAIQSIEIIEKL
jgi:hypothetical protein